MNEITIGETAAVTNFVGASAPANHSAAAKPQNIPSLWSDRRRDRSGSLLARDKSSPVFIALSAGAAILSGEPPGGSRIERPGRPQSTNVFFALRVRVASWELYVVV
jgi:hypothetical protein